MAKVLIASNNDNRTELHDFFESCADEAKQMCFDKGVEYTSVSPPDFAENVVLVKMQEHSICVIAGHGDNNGIYNENGTDVVSTRTNNYNFDGKAFYGIACCCAQNLQPQLRTIGLSLFVGYSDTFNVRGDREPFVTSALSGLKSFLSGDNVKVSKQKMQATFDEQIDILDNIDPMAAVEMVHNKEALAFEGDDNLVLTDLK